MEQLHQAPDKRPGNYYVTAIDGERFFYMAGPYGTHANALERVDQARDIASNHDGRAWFMAWGTCRSDDHILPGTLTRLGMI